MVTRKALQWYWRMTRGLTVGVRGVVIDDQDRVLLIRHTYRKGWYFPGGGVEKAEAAITSVQRELEEEAGVVCESLPRLFGIYTNFASFPGDHVVLYIIDAWQQPTPPAPNYEIAEHGFFPCNALPTGVARSVPRRLAEIRDGALPSLDW
ncbi:MAG: NUDIX domain-containing protein [Pseudomonadota bacterium]